MCVVLGVFSCVCCVFKIFGGCLQDFWWVSSRFLVGVFKIFGGCLQDFWWVSSRFLVGVFMVGLDPPTSAGAPPLERPKFRSFFLSPRQQFHSFFSLCVFSLNFGVFEGRDPKMCTFGLSGCRVKTAAALGRRGFT